MDIRKIVEDKILDLEESGELKKKIEEKVEETLIKVVTDSVSSYNIRNQLEEKLEKEISPILEYVSFSNYAIIMKERLLAIMESVMTENLVKQVDKLYEEIFVYNKKELKLSEIHEMFRKTLMEDEENFHKEFKFNIETEYDGDFKRLNVIFMEPDRFKENKFRATGYKEEPLTIFVLQTENLCFSDKALTKPAYLSQLEKVLLNAYINETPIIVDMEDGDVGGYLEP